MLTSNYLAGVIQLDPRESYVQNLEMAQSLIAEGAAKGARLLVLPEVWTYQGENAIAYAEDIPGGKTFAMLSGLAAKYNIWIHGGSITERIPGNSRKMYNTTMVIAPDGSLASKYRKIHTFDVNIENSGFCRESDRICAGEEVVSCDMGNMGSAGLSICYDLRFPELFRLQVLKGADIFCLSAAFLQMTGKNHWEPLIRARAIENGCYMLAAGQCGKKATAHMYGHSMIVDPWGNVLAEAGESPEVCIAEIRSEFLQNTRRQLNTLDNRKENVYCLR